MAKEKTILLLSELADWIERYQEEHQVGYQLIHAHYYFSGGVALILQKKWGVPLVETFHSLGAVKRKTLGSQDPSPAQRLELERRICQAADRIIATAPQEKQDLVGFYQANPDHIAVIPCGVNLDLFRPEAREAARNYTGIPTDRFLVTYVGRLERRKGVATLLEAIGILLEKQPTLPLQAIIVGGSPQHEQDQNGVLERRDEEHMRYQDLITRYHITDRVTFTGGKPQNLLYHYYSAGDVTVIPSYYEPFGMTAIEALACGSSVIASSVGGLKTTVKDGHVGLQFEAQNAPELAEKIVYLAEHPQINASFRQHARHYAEKHYSWQTVSKQIAAVYDGALSRAA